jgi:hypothetical protein
VDDHNQSSRKFMSGLLLLRVNVPEHYRRGAGYFGQLSWVVAHHQIARYAHLFRWRRTQQWLNTHAFPNDLRIRVTQDPARLVVWKAVALSGFIIDRHRTNTQLQRYVASE